MRPRKDIRSSPERLVVRKRRRRIFVPGDIGVVGGLDGEVGLLDLPLMLVFFFGIKLTRRFVIDGEMFVESTDSIAS